jgi:malate dehydrogenase
MMISDIAFFPHRSTPKGSYGVEKGLLSSFPVRVRGGKLEIVQELPINDFSRAKIDASVAELKEERSLVGELL